MKSFLCGILVCAVVGGLIADLATSHLDEVHGAVVEKSYSPPSSDLTFIPDGQGNLIPVWTHHSEQFRVIVRDDYGTTTSTSIAADHYGRVREGDSARVVYRRGGWSGLCYHRRVL